MHIHIDRDRPLAFFCHVLLDGERLRCCREACEERGVAVGTAHTYDPATGRIHVLHHDGIIEQYRKVGKVEIVLMDGEVPTRIQEDFHRRHPCHHC